ncbi:MAG: FliI/YscN family ATPase [Acidimicrobiia bacterium]|nr:FliI/YscN family ATPase [Acidimicrobiia bacterium]
MSAGNGLLDLLPRARRAAAPRRSGRVRRVLGLGFEVAGIEPAIGDAVVVRSTTGSLVGEVVALGADGALCMPYGEVRGVRIGDEAEAMDAPIQVPVGDALLGRVLDGLGRPIDDGPSLAGLPTASMHGEPPHPLRRAMVDTQLQLGVRALDTLIPCGKGQRLGILAGSGVGKSSLLSMIVRGTEADVSVLALVGERGREVREFIEHDLGPEGLARSVVVVATSDQPPLVRLQAAFVATRIAESFRDRGRDVVLMMDSVTRFAMAQREVGLSAGETPATRGYPPSVFAMLPRLLERAGAGSTGSITGLYTVLVEGDDLNDPVGDSVRSILDGHISLSRDLANAGHFPSIDVLASVSRVSGVLYDREQYAMAAELRQLLAAHREARDLIDIGAYASGSNPLVDRAIRLRDGIDRFLRQPKDLQSTVPGAWQELSQLLAADGRGA